MKSPDASVVSVLASPVPRFLTVTFAPEITAPVGSVSRPVMVPVVFWPDASRKEHAQISEQGMRILDFIGTSVVSTQNLFLFDLAHSWRARLV